ncbi:MAG: tetraacyldisaccharide 4'-kinase [Pseudobdellovibrionaceae bacterium]|jgi:tetraacyldisaccharide 4'-kinase|nr:tetraacyldisaccharide 4'-kinase [Pseudobdellovibrionaceae bacterium]
MKTPDFWYKDSPNLLSHILSPMARLYQWADRHNKTQKRQRQAPIQVLCVGNITAGGSGKTPVVLALLKLLLNHKISLSPAFLTRGYKSHVIGPEYVDNSHNPDLWGDEALLLADHGQTIVAKSRYDGAHLAADTGRDIVLLDDGLQHYGLKKDLSFCVVDGAHGLGNGLVLPAGPLRVSLPDALPDIDAFILIGDPVHPSCKEILSCGKSIFKASVRPTNLNELSRDISYLAFCGIGLPQKFKKTLEQNGFHLVGFEAFADHHSYSADDLSKLVNTALKKNVRLITTEKDFARLPDFQKKSMIDVLKIELAWEDEAALSKYIKEVLGK